MSHYLIPIYGIQPVAKARPRINKNGHVWTPQKTVDTEELIRMRVRQFLAKSRIGATFPTKNPCSLDLYCYFLQPKGNKTVYHTEKPDADNVGKLTMDALNGMLWDDDKQIYCIRISKYWVKTEAESGYFFDLEVLDSANTAMISSVTSA